MPCESRRHAAAERRRFAGRGDARRHGALRPRAHSRWHGYDIDGPRVQIQRVVAGSRPAHMTAISEADVLAALRTVQEPELGGDLVTRNMIRELVIDGASVA